MARVASEYTQVVYLVNKAAAEGCEVVNTLTEVSNITAFSTDASVSARSRKT